MLPYSLLDLSPIPQGKTAADALRNTAALARHAESLGYTRYWLAEHHNSTGIASAATSVVIGHVASQTSRIRVGSGGIMLPNHAPMVIAEQFGTLAALYGDRIDLGVGRAPGTDPLTAYALRRGQDRSDQFPQEVIELLGFLGDPQDGQKIVATPGASSHVPVWMLGSSLFGAELAAQLGLPYAFASHFAPDALSHAVQTYRSHFRPAITQTPHFMLLVNVFAADTDEEAALLRSSMAQGFINLRRGQPGPLPAPVDDLSLVAAPQEIAMADRQLRVSAVGSPDRVRERIAKLIEMFAPDEIMFSGHIYDHAARLRSFEIAAEAMQSLGQASAA